MLCRNCRSRHLSHATFEGSGGLLRPLGFHPYYCSNCGDECIRFEPANLIHFWSRYKEPIVFLGVLVVVIMATIFCAWSCDQIHWSSTSR